VVIRSIKKKNNNQGKALFHDSIMISIGIIIAILFVRSGLLDIIINSVKDYYVISSFIAGIFFTSIFTIAPASIALIHIAEESPISGVVIFGALGAMCGDLILFFFIRDKFTDDLLNIMNKKAVKHILHSFHFGFLKYISPIIGALIIASPLPDEFGITLLGMSKVKTIILVPVSLVMNTLGIYALISFYHLL
jgi:hypothetical protein